MKPLDKRLTDLEARTSPESGLRIVITHRIMRPTPDGPLEVQRLRKVVRLAQPGGESTSTGWLDVSMYKDTEKCPERPARVT